MKICFISSLFGNRNNKPGVFARVPNCDYFLFTDKKPSAYKTSWDVINIAGGPNISAAKGPIRKSRYAKFMGWKLLKDKLNKEYDYIYYCDAHWSPMAHVNWEEVSKSIKTRQERTARGFYFAQDSHEDPQVRKFGITAEAKNIIKYHRDTQENIDKTLSFFLDNYPEVNLNAPQYYENTMFGYEPNELIKSITQEFWEAYTTADITYRDQPLWNLFLLKHNVKPREINIREKFTGSGIYGDHQYVDKPWTGSETRSCCGKQENFYILREKEIILPLKSPVPSPALGGCWSKNKFPPHVSHHAFHHELSRKEQIDFLIRHKFFKENCERYSEEDREEFMEKGLYLGCREWKSILEGLKDL